MVPGDLVFNLVHPDRRPTPALVTGEGNQRGPGGLVGFFRHLPQEAGPEDGRQAGEYLEIAGGGGVLPVAGESRAGLFAQGQGLRRVGGVEPVEDFSRLLKMAGGGEVFDQRDGGAETPGVVGRGLIEKAGVELRRLTGIAEDFGLRGDGQAGGQDVGLVVGELPN